jgi:hypothetical protein
MRANEFLLEVPLPSDWDTTVYSKPTSFKAMVDYAVERALRLGGGSSRVAFVIPFEGRPTALKIAKNAKGIAQNNAEYQILKDPYVPDIVIPFIDYGQDARGRTTWLQTEVAQKASEAKLCKFFGIERLYQLVDYAKSVVGKKPYKYGQQILDDLDDFGQTPAQREVFLEYADKLAELSSNFNVELGDFERAANWGVYQGQPVVIDIGFTTDVLKTHYSE